LARADSGRGRQLILQVAACLHLLFSALLRRPVRRCHTVLVFELTASGFMAWRNY